MFTYQKHNRYFAQIAEGIKDLGIEELSELNARNVEPAFRGITFEADKTTLYRINYSSRLVSRVLAPLVSFPCENPQVLYSRAKRIQWTEIFSPDETFAIFANVSNSTINHSHYAAQCLKDAIVDCFRGQVGRRPSVDVRDPDVWLNLHIVNDKATISLDTSGGSLHRRSYRKETVSAPMKETVAAAVIRLAKWDGQMPLYDPMCGSGTILCEALMHYCRIPPGIFRRHFGFEHLPDFDRAVWNRVKQAVDQRMRQLPSGLIQGSDRARRAISASRTNICTLRGGRGVGLDVLDFRKINSLEKRVIVTNPPYGIRMGKGEDLGTFYKDLGDFLKQRCKGSTAYIFFGDRSYIKKVGLRSSWKRPIKTGGLDGRLVKFELY